MVYKDSEKRKFATEVLKGIGAPTSQANVEMLVRWMEAEDSRSKMQATSEMPVAIERFNPLNTTMKMAGDSGPLNSAGVRGYSDFNSGVQATVNTLNLSYYKDIVSHLKANTGGWEKLRSTIGSSPWGTFKQYAKPTQEETTELFEVTKKMIARSAYVDPEIQRILQDFKRRGLQGPDAELELELAIENSKWAKKVSDRVRATVASTLKLDEPTYQENRELEKDRIKQLAIYYGANFDEATLNNLVDNVMLLGWGEEELSDALIGAIGFNKDYLKGMAGEASQKILQGVRDNGFEISTGSSEFVNYIKQVLDAGGPNSEAGRVIVNDIVGNFRNQASQLYPQYKNRFQEGANLADILSPYRTAAATLLEVPIESIGLKDNLMQQVLQQGESLNLFDFTKMVRKSPDWQYTSNAWDTILGSLEGVLEDFGFRF